MLFSILPSLLLLVAPSLGAPNPRAGPWQPALGAKWQIVLSSPIKVTNGAVKPDVPVWDVDLMDTPKSTIDALHASGKKVICYFSAGTYEEWRSDAGQWDKRDFGSPMGDWPGETWVNVKSASVRRVMEKRIAMAASKGCDAIDPDNVDAYDNENGLGLTRKDAADFVKFLAATAASHGMSTGLKNAQDIIPDVLNVVAFSVNEQCRQYNECDTYADFTRAGKPVFNIEYPKNAPRLSSAQLCEAERKFKFSTVMKAEALNGATTYCDGTKVTTPTS